MDIDRLKRKLRGLKKVEKRIRFGYGDNALSGEFVWDEYFSTKSGGDERVKYPLWLMSKLDRQKIKEIIEEYFYAVYFRKYKESGLEFSDIYDPNVLSAFGLAPGASIDDIKKKFRELAKKYHPDRGGDNGKMIEILDIYHKLLGSDR